MNFQRLPQHETCRRYNEQRGPLHPQQEQEGKP